MSDFLTHSAARALVDHLEAQIIDVDEVARPPALSGQRTAVGADTPGLTEPPD